MYNNGTGLLVGSIRYITFASLLFLSRLRRRREEYRYCYNTTCVAEKEREMLNGDALVLIRRETLDKCDSDDGSS